MKSVLVMALLAVSPAMAVSYGDGSGLLTGETVVQYISWCDGNSVIGQDNEGNLYVRANCDDDGLECKTTEKYRAQRSIVTATCVEKK